MNLRLLAVAFILISFYGCTKDNTTPVIRYTNITKGGNLYIDKVNDVGKSFVDLDTLLINISNDSINVSIGLLKMPDSLIFSQQALPLNELNYEWSIYFDMDSSNSITPGDISFSVMRFKFDTENVSYNILFSTQQDIWLNNGQTSSILADLDVYTSLKGNNICFSVPKNIASPLTSINNNTNFFFKAYFNDGTNAYTDYYPDR